MEILRNLFFAYVATVVAFVSPLVPTSMQAKVKVPQASDLRNVSATASGSASIIDDSSLIGDAGRVIIDDGAFIGKPKTPPSIIDDSRLIGDAGRVIIDDGAVIGVPTPVIISDPPKILPCGDEAPVRVSGSAVVGGQVPSRPCPPISPATPPKNCQYITKQVQCFRAPCDPIQELVCTTPAPLPNGCVMQTVCEDVPYPIYNESTTLLPYGAAPPYSPTVCRVVEVCPSPSVPVSTKAPVIPTEAIVSITLDQNTKQCAEPPWQIAGHQAPDAWLKANGISFIKVWERQNRNVIAVCGASLSSNTIVDVVTSQKAAVEKLLAKQTPVTTAVPKPTVVISPLPTAMLTSTPSPTHMAFCDYAPPPPGCAYIKGPKFNTVTQCGMELKCTGALVPTSTPTPPSGCYYEQMNCIQGGPVGSTPTSCPAKLICKATGAPVPTLPSGCKYVEACKPGVYDQGDWRLSEISMEVAKSRVTSGNSCYTSVQCIEPTKVQQPTPTPPANGCFTIDVCYGQDSPIVDRTWGSGFLPESGVPICKQQVVCPSPTAKPLPTATPVKATPIPSPQASCAPSVGTCGFNLNTSWAGVSDITCQVPNSGKNGEIVTLTQYPSVCMGGYDTGTYKDAGMAQAQVKCENGKWKTFHPYYFWTYPGWKGCGTPVNEVLGSKSIILPKITVAPTVVPKPTVVISPLPVVTLKATPTPPEGCYYEQMNCIQGGPVGSIPTLCPAKLVCPPTKVPPPITKPSLTPTPVVVCDYAAPPPGCAYIKGSQFNSTTQCGMELRCTGALIPTSTLTQVPKPTILISRLPVVTLAPTVVLKPTVVISPLPVFTITPTPTPNLEMKKLQEQVDGLNKKLDVQSKELTQTNSLLKRMADYLSKFFKF